MSTYKQTATTYFNAGYNCAQSVLCAFAPAYNLPLELAYKMSAPFGGGIARTGEMCGAVTGALMVLGLSQSHPIPYDAEKKDQVYVQAQEFLALFNEKHASTLCQELIGYDMKDQQQLQQARETGVFHTLRPHLVGDAVELLQKLIRGEMV